MRLHNFLLVCLALALAGIWNDPAGCIVSAHATEKAEGTPTASTAAPTAADTASAVRTAEALERLFNSISSLRSGRDGDLPPTLTPHGALARLGRMLSLVKSQVIRAGAGESDTGAKSRRARALGGLSKALRQAIVSTRQYNSLLTHARRLTRPAPKADETAAVLAAAKEDKALKEKAEYWKAKYFDLRSRVKAAGEYEVEEARCTRVEDVVVAVSDAEFASKRLSTKNVQMAVDALRTCGFFFVDRALDPTYLARLRRLVLEFFAGCHEEKCEFMNENSPKRFEMLLPLIGPFLDEWVLANPFVLPAIRQVLGSEIMVENVGYVNSLPGAPYQAWHIDCEPLLFGDEETPLLPAHGVIANFNLVDCTAETGCTEFIPRSHICGHTDYRRTEECVQLLDAIFQWQGAAGSATVYDYRLMHRGGQNTSKDMRPIFNVMYVRKWYRDYCNFEDRSMCDGTEDCEASKKRAKRVLKNASRKTRGLLKGTEQLYYDETQWPRSELALQEPQDHSGRTKWAEELREEDILSDEQLEELAAAY